MKRTLLAAALAAMVAGTAQAAVTEFIIFKRPNYQGDSHVVKGQVDNLANDGGFAQNASSLIVRGGFWEVCTRDHFQGECRVLPEGQYPSLGRDLNNRIYSVRFLGEDNRHANRVAREYRDLRQELREARREAREEVREARQEWREGRRHGSVELYGQPAFRGRSVQLEGNSADLSEHRFDGRASSMIVFGGTWQVCSQPRYEGRCSVYGPGRYPELASLDDRISSVRQVR